MFGLVKSESGCLLSVFPRAAMARTVALHHIRSLEPVSASHHVQLVVNNRHTELQPTAIHKPDLDPRVGPQVIVLYSRRT